MRAAEYSDAAELLRDVPNGDRCSREARRSLVVRVVLVRGSGDLVVGWERQIWRSSADGGTLALPTTWRMIRHEVVVVGQRVELLEPLDRVVHLEVFVVTLAGGRGDCDAAHEEGATDDPTPVGQDS